MIFYTHERNFGCRITEYIYRGLHTVVLENALLRISVLADKGTDIFEFLHKPTDTDFMFRSPWGVRNPAQFVPTLPAPAGAFVDFYEGGWQDCMPTGGKPCEYQGLPFGAHGELTTIPWNYQIVEDTPEAIAVRFWTRTYRTPFLVEKTMRLERGRAALDIQERITNEGRVKMDLMCGQHPALGVPFLDESCVIDLPGGQVDCMTLTPQTRFVPGVYDWPLVLGKDGKSIDLRLVGTIADDTSDTLRIINMPASWYAVTNTRRQVGFGLTWTSQVYPVLWFWQVYGGAYNAPWYGRTYNIALEPFSTRQPHLVAAMQDGSAHVLAPGQSLEAHIIAVAYAGIPGVREITPAGDVIA